MARIIFLQLNELNFDYVRRYIELGHLPNFARFFAEHGVTETSSETRHELANPWIQWPTVHTGLDYSDHGVFRLGDIVRTEHPHIYEVLESQGVKVAALSPFNAKNNTVDPAFFVPDPWTKTRFVGSASLRMLYDALCEVTDDYAEARISPRALLRLALGALPNIRWSTLGSYVAEAWRYFVGRKKWYRAIVCDRLLFDTFVTQWQRHQPGFATLFLNGGAHLQHHYLFSSRVYRGKSRNPTWHVPAGEDPLLQILTVYDELLGDLVRLMGDARLLIATGLHQDPHERETYYYRLDDHASFLRRIGIDYVDTYRLMTEDFVVRFGNAEAASAAEAVLSAVQTVGRADIFYLETADRSIRTNRTSGQIFHIENRGDDLYLQLKPTAIMMPADVSVRSGETIVDGFDGLVSLAQYKNTHHVGIGYYCDSGVSKGQLPASIPLRSIFDIIAEAFGIRKHDVAA